MSSEPPEPKTKMRIVYSRDFLLSVGESEVCKKLPAGFDASILSELQEVSAGVLERSRPLGRLDGPGGYSYASRGGSSGGRWDARSSGSSDQDGDLPDRESVMQDRSSGNQFRRNRQNTEHDGLLGSGAFPRPSGYVGHLASKDQGSAHQLNRSSERYQPPRPYKAAPFSRNIDSINDETFGSFESSNEDRAEEERKRRESFELMRKEQQKALQEKKTAPDNEKENIGDYIMSLLQNSAEKTGSTTKNEKPDGSTFSSISQEDTTKTSSVPPAPTTRPLVPPGFSNAFVEKKLQPRSSNTSLETKACTGTSDVNLSTVAHFSGQLEGNQSAIDITASKSKEKEISDNIASVGQKQALPSSSSGGVVTSAEYASGILKVTKNWKDDSTDEYSIENQGKSKNMNSVKQDNSISILEQFFGNALSKSSSGLPAYVESQQLKTDDDVMVSSLPEASKFAHWFLDGDSRPAEELSSKSLLSMIVKNENLGQEKTVTGPPVSGGPIENLSPKALINNSDASSKLFSFTSPAPAVGNLEQDIGVDIPKPVPVLMTCEDLEQTMLAQVACNSCSSQHNPVQEHQTTLDEPSTAQEVAVDDHASHHLLSLLQKGTNSKGSSLLGFHIGSADEPQSSAVNGIVNGGISGTDAVNKAETVPTSGKNLTLEALFGASFMNELHSKEAPVSVRGSAPGGTNYGSAETGGTLFSSSNELYHPDEQILPFSHKEDGRAPKEPGAGIEYRNSTLPGPSKGIASNGEKGLEIQLPEEDNLFTVNDSSNARKPDLLALMKSGRVEGLSSEKAVDEFNYRFHSLVPGDAEHIQVLGPDALGSHSHDKHCQVESQNLYHLLQGRAPAQAPHPIVDHIANRNQQATFNVPQVIHRDPHPSFPPNMNPVQHTLHAPGDPHLDPVAHHLMLQHFSMHGSFPTQGLPRGVPPSHSMHHLPGYRPEMGNVNSLHMHPRQPNYGGEFGLMMPGPEVGGNHPEALERLIQMELTARSKQIHPAMAVHGHAPGGIYGPELDMNLRQR